jgi:PTH1 family peptidyl-tRNA hydrolase
VLLKPVTFMNQSGRAVKACADFFHLPMNRILVVHDDLDLPAGRIKVVRNGGPGGHKGVASIIEHLGSMEFPRIKIGIGRPRYGESPEDYVLAPFYQDESELMQRVFKMAARACQLFIFEGVESVMNQINRQIFTNEEEKNLCRD